MQPLTSKIANAPILIVEDGEFNRDLIAKALKKSGFKAIEFAENGKVALEKTYLLKPSLVILDIDMPVMDGFEYCERIRKNSAFNFMPILVQTALEDREVKLRALSSGADDFLYKPLDQIELVLRARIHLERHALIQDKEEMCQYLTMGMKDLKQKIDDLNKVSGQKAIMHYFEKHFDMLETVALNYDPKVA